MLVPYRQRLEIPPPFCLGQLGSAALEDVEAGIPRLGAVRDQPPPAGPVAVVSY
jgi:hypothetical protein